MTYRIHNEIQKLGWDSAFFPPQHSKDHGIWNDLMMKNFELDEDGSCLFIAAAEDTLMTLLSCL